MPNPIKTSTGKISSEAQAGSRSREFETRPSVTEPYADILSLQNTAGNQAVSQLLQPGTEANGVPQIVEEVLKRGSGQPLDSDTRAFMESRMGHDFSEVRIHTDHRDSELAGELGARAYTAGSDIAFAEGQYLPGTPSGRELLAHELVHVVQQSRELPSKTAAPLSQPSEPSEMEAEQVSSHITTGSMHIGQTVPAGQVQRALGPQDATELYKKHLKPRIDSLRRGQRVKGEAFGETKKEDSEESWKEKPEEIIQHANQAFEFGLMILGKFHKDIIRNGGSSEDLERISQRIEGLEKSHELFETGAHAFEKGVSWVEVGLEIKEFSEAVSELNNISDFRATDETRERAAHAFDGVFAAAGKLGDHLPKGPWKAYAELLAHFKDNGGFFYNTTRNLTKWVRDADKVTENSSVLARPEANVRSEPRIESLDEQALREASTMSLADVGPDVKRKYDVVANRLPNVVAERYARFRTAYEKLVALERQATQTGRLWRFGGDYKSLRGEIYQSAIETHALLDSLDTAFTVYLPIDAADQPFMRADLMVIDRYIKQYA